MVGSHAPGRTGARRALLAMAIGAAALAPIAASTASAAPSASLPVGVAAPGGHSYLRLRATSATGSVPARTLGGTRLSTARSTFVVTYHGFPSNAKASFQRAVDLWALLVDSDVPIRIDATWKAMPAGVLGGAGPEYFYRDFPGAPKTGTWYPVALANARAGRDLYAGVDIGAEFASNRSDWYLGTDGAVPPNKVDFTSVVLHEIGHGLGITDSTEVTGSIGSWGVGSGYPFAYDRLAQNASGTALASLPNDSATLKAALTSNGVRWGGAQATAANGGTKPKLYSPSTFQLGSSIAHLDEATYATGTSNALMTPYIDDGEALHDPGDIGLGMLRDLGWQTTGAKSAPDKPTITTTVGGNGRAILAWRAPSDIGRQLLTGFRIYRFTSGSSVADAAYDIGPGVTSTSVTGLTNGTTYRFALAAINASGAGAQTAKTFAVVPSDLGPISRTDSFVRQQFLDFAAREPSAAESLTWLASLQSGARTPASTIGGIATIAAVHDPSTRMTRLYRAYFQRLPDFGGYTYWTGRLRAGTSLKKASDTFAASSEFTNKYGKLTNRAFVTLVYANVLGRAPDSSGLDYWVGKLDRKTISRGSVMLNFSESSENTRKTESQVNAVQLRAAMLRRMPTKAEFDADVAYLDGPAGFSDLAGQLLHLPEYDARIS